MNYLIYINIYSLIIEYMLHSKYYPYNHWLNWKKNNLSGILKHDKLLLG